MHGSERSLILKEKFMAEVSGPIEVIARLNGPSSLPLPQSVQRYGAQHLLTPQIARHPAFKLSDIHDLSKDELRERTMEKVSPGRAPICLLVTNRVLIRL
jgi:hypothetical protein